MRILSLDGGGVRGLSSLLVLRELMERVGVKRGLSTPASPRPCDCFDLIISTGTGGISALFLGRLRMTVDQAIEEYIRMAQTAFQPSSSGFTLWLRGRDALLDGDLLDRVVGDVVEKFLGSRHARLADPSSDSFTCRTAVLAATDASVDAPPYIFRSYATKQAASQFTIREVARATVSAAGLFASISMGNPPVRFLDAGISGYSNPAATGLDEAAMISPSGQVDCLVSIGAGLQKIVSMDDSWARVAEVCTAIVHSCERVHDTVFRMRQRDGSLYYRFNVDRGLDIMEWREAGPYGTLAGITGSYMRWAEVSDRLDSCAWVLNGGERVSVKSGPFGTGQAAGPVSLRTLDLASNERLRDGAGASHLDDPGIPTLTRNNFRLLRREMHLHRIIYPDDDEMNVRLHQAESLTDGRVVLVKTYEGSQRKAQLFSQDLIHHKNLWDPSVLQLIGASRPSDGVPFQVYHLPCTDFESFGDWYRRTMKSDPVETIRGLYDMRISIKNIVAIGYENCIWLKESRRWGSVVKVERRGNNLEWSLVYVGDMFGPGDKFSISDPSVILNLVKSGVRDEYEYISQDSRRVSPIVPAFCAGSSEWINDDRRLEDRLNLDAGALDLPTLGRALVENRWLGICTDDVQTNGHIRLGDIGYLSQDGLFQVVTNVNVLLTYERLDDHAWTMLEHTFMEPHAVVQRSGKSYDRFEFQGRPSEEWSMGSAYRGLDNDHAWEILQLQASEIIAHYDLSVAPHELRLITEVWLTFAIQLYNGSTRSKVPFGQDAAPTWFVFTKFDNAPRGSVPRGIAQYRASFSEEPAWLGDEAAYEVANYQHEPNKKSRRRSVRSLKYVEIGIHKHVETQDAFTLECDCHVSISYLQLPPGATHPYISEVHEP